jgi:hypothetical protein
VAIRRRAWLGLREARASCYRADPDGEQCQKRPATDMRVKKRPINVEAVVASIAPKLSSDLRALAAAIRQKKNMNVLFIVTLYIVNLL